MKYLKLTGFVFFFICLSFSSVITQAQNKILKGDGKVFYRETFNWGDSTNVRGWVLPNGYYLEDPTDNGFNWHWWPNDSLVAGNTSEPPLRSTSADDGHLCLFGDLYQDFINPISSRIPVDNSIVFPPIDCSEHSSVILQFETNFMNIGPEGYLRGSWIMNVEVSADYGMHWASFNAGFGAGSKTRPHNIEPGETALFRANITAIAANQPSVLIRINWKSYFGLYYWLIDDLELLEALNNDTRLDYVDVQWDDLIPETDESISYMMPVSQIADSFGLFRFEAGISNIGEFTQSDVVLELTITKDSSIVYQVQESIPSLDIYWKDTLTFEGKYEPSEIGHYEIKYRLSQAEEDDNPIDNEKTLFFNVTDSIYSRCSDKPESAYAYGSESYWGDEFDLQVNISHFIGSIFPIYGDCEIDGVSVYIMGGLADGLIDYRFVVWRQMHDINDPVVEPYLLLTSEIYDLDSAIFNKWTYLPVDKDGESEFVKAGDVLYAGVQYSNFHEDENVRKTMGLSIGSTKTFPVHRRTIVGHTPIKRWDYFTTRERNLMIRLIINDHTGTSVQGESLTSQFFLDQNYPNPFSEETMIAYTIDKGTHVLIEITNITGQVVLTIDEGFKQIGNHQVSLKSGHLPPGLYFYTLSTGFKQDTKSMIISN